MKNINRYQNVNKLFLVLLRRKKSFTKLQIVLKAYNLVLLFPLKFLFEILREP